MSHLLFTEVSAEQQELVAGGKYGSNKTTNLQANTVYVIDLFGQQNVNVGIIQGNVGRIKDTAGNAFFGY
jgi:hypothetical protein